MANFGSKCLLIAFVAVTSTIYAEAPAKKPNVVLVMTDDQGYGDLSCHGNPVLKTPHLDELYKSSVRLTNFHVDPTCSPTRSSLMTGCYSHRVNVWHTLTGRNQMELGRPTMAEVFKQAGYRTAHYGKWHLGGDYPFRPIDRGFDEWIGQGDGGTGSSACYWGNDRVNDVYFGRDAQGQVFRRRIEGYGPDVLTDGAIDFIRRNKKAPFFVYLATYLPHDPLTLPSKEANDHYAKLLAGNKHNNKKLSSYFTAIERVDKNIGRIRHVLEEEGLAENTIFVFLTDNGDTHGHKLFNAGMRGHKGDVYDGGHRVPCFIHWPAGHLNQPRDVDTLAAHFDLLPTLAALCDVDLPQDIQFDGKNLNSLLYNTKSSWPERALVVESQRVKVPEKFRRFVVMTDRWRMVGRDELYDMKKDPGQRQNVAEQYPDVVDRLKAAYGRYWDEVTPNDHVYSRPRIGRDTPNLVLDSSDLIEHNSAWSQGHIASASRPATGFWPIQVVDEGSYRVELRRWPREANASISGVPRVHGKSDAWLHDKPVRGIMYRGRPKAFAASGARLTLGKRTLEKSFAPGSKSVEFNVRLSSGPLDISACFLDADGREVYTVFYVYIRPSGNSG